MNWSGVLSNGLWVGLIVWLVGFRFRPHVEKLFERVESAGPKGLTFAAVQQTQLQVTSTPDDLGELKEIAGVARTPATTIVEKNLRRVLTTIPEQERIDRLVSTLAVTNLERDFERTYIAIFGSQIYALQQLNTRGPISLADIRALWEPFEQRYPDIYNIYTFDKWLAFLTNRPLVTVDNDRAEITVFGREFLMYLPARNLSDSKLY
jgi:hypothetical protein